MHHILDLCKQYLRGDLDRVDFNNSLRDTLGDISDQEHYEFVKWLVMVFETV